MDAKATKITHVALSDLHLGEEDSLLTAVKDSDGTVDPTKTSPVLQGLVDCIRELVGKQKKKPILVLNGDVLELALAPMEVASMAFERFLVLTMDVDGGLFSRIIYIPGNHDHHIWELGREQQYAEKIKTLASEKTIPPPYHTTGMFLDDKRKSYPTCSLLTAIAQRLPGFDKRLSAIELAYPNYATTKRNGRFVVFHHGHFVEPIYQLMSKLRTILFPEREGPSTIYELEGENFAWIDFLWSTLGRSGGVGHDVEQIYEQMHTARGREELVQRFASGIARHFDIPKVPGDFLEKKTLIALFRSLLGQVDGLERHCDIHDHSTLPLSDGAHAGLMEYLNVWLQGQIGEEYSENETGDFRFVFGHTHKPFSRALRAGSEYRNLMDVYNTGGWVISGVDQKRTHGAAAVLVDDSRDVVSLRLYNEGSASRPYVEDAQPRELPKSNLCLKIEGMIEGSPSSWDRLADAVRFALGVRAEYLRGRLDCFARKKPWYRRMWSSWRSG